MRSLTGEMKSIHLMNMFDTLDVPFVRAHREAGAGEIHHHVTLFQSNLIDQDSMKIFVSESLSAAVLDSAVTSTVAGKTWMDCYIDSLPEEKQTKISSSKSQNMFKFVSGDPAKSLHKVKIPASIGNQDILIESDVVDNDISVLISKSAMRKANTRIDFQSNTVTMLGQTQQVIITTSSHYAIPLSNSQQILKDSVESPDKTQITLFSRNSDLMSDKKKVAHKLHSQLSHPTAEKLIKSVNSAGLSDDQKLNLKIKSIKYQGIVKSVKSTKDQVLVQ